MGMSGTNQAPVAAKTVGASPAQAQNSQQKSVFVNFKALVKICNPFIEELVIHLYPNGSYIGKHWTVGNAQGQTAKKDGSMRITFEGEYRGWGNDFTTGSGNMNILNMWAARFGITEREASKQICDFLSLPITHLSTSGNLSDQRLLEIQKEVKVKASAEVLRIAKAVKTGNTASLGLATSKSAIERDENGNPLPVSRNRPANPSYLAIGRNELRENKKALDWLHARGISEKAVKFFNLMLVPELNSMKGLRNMTPFALQFPLRGEDGVFDHQFFYYNIPGLTENPICENGWGKSAPTAYFSTKKTGNQTYLMICEGFKDIWRTWEELNAMGIDEHFMLVTSSHGKNAPWQYYQKDFWQGYKTILLAHDMDKTGAAIAQETANLAYEFGGKQCLRFPVITEKDGKDLTDMFNSFQIGKKEMRQLIMESKPLPPRLLGPEEAEEQKAQINPEP